MRILAVDKDRMYLELLNEALPSAGLPDITTVSAPGAAQDLITQSPVAFDCVLTGLQMPEMTGVELCAWVRQQAGYETTPVIFVTAASQHSFMNEAFAAGATDYATKPISPPDLAGRIGLAARMAEERDASQLAPGDLSTPFNIPDVPGVIDLLAIENYLRQLGRAGMFATAAFGVTIANLRFEMHTATSEEYAFTVTDVAETLALVLKQYDCYVSHKGNGRFVCVSYGSNLPDQTELLEKLYRQLDKLELSFDSGDPFDLKLVVGPHIPLGRRSARTAIAALDYAFDQINASDANETINLHHQRKPWWRILSWGT